VTKVQKRITQSMFVAAAYESVVSVNVSKRQIVRMLDKQSKAEFVLPQVLIEPHHDHTEQVPHLIVVVILNATKKSENDQLKQSRNQNIRK
jgi:hypothetical protein